MTIPDASQSSMTTFQIALRRNQGSATEARRFAVPRSMRWIPDSLDWWAWAKMSTYLLKKKARPNCSVEVSAKYPRTSADELASLSPICEIPQAYTKVGVRPRISIFGCRSSLFCRLKFRGGA